MTINEQSIIPIENITAKILYVRGRKIMLDRDLAELYGVETRALNQAVKRNIERFPEDFMFQLTEEEFINWKSQIVISNSDNMGLRKLPYAFTENGVAMLSSVLNSKKAIMVNILIMRTFIKLREMLSTNEELRNKLEGLESRQDKSEQYIQAIIGSINKMIEEQNTLKPDNNLKIGFLRE